MQKTYLGGRKNLRKTMQTVVEDGRQEQNRHAKDVFKSGPHARVAQGGDETSSTRGKHERKPDGDTDKQQGGKNVK